MPTPRVKLPILLITKKPNPEYDHTAAADAQRSGKPYTINQEIVDTYKVIEMRVRTASIDAYNVAESEDIPEVKATVYFTGESRLPQMLVAWTPDELDQQIALAERE